MGLAEGIYPGTHSDRESGTSRRPYVLSCLGASARRVLPKNLIWGCEGPSNRLRAFPARPGLVVFLDGGWFRDGPTECRPRQARVLRRRIRRRSTVGRIRAPPGASVAPPVVSQDPDNDNLRSRGEHPCRWNLPLGLSSLSCSSVSHYSSDNESKCVRWLDLCSKTKPAKAPKAPQPKAPRAPKPPKGAGGSGSNGKAKGHHKNSGGSGGRPGTANPTPGGHDKPGKSHGKGPRKEHGKGHGKRHEKGPGKGHKPGRDKTRAGKSNRNPAGAGRHSSSGGGDGTGSLGPAPTREGQAANDPKHVAKASAAPVKKDDHSVNAPLFQAGAAVPATKRFAFPLFLTMIVVMFLLLQSRFDREDEKLTRAPVDYSDALLRFE